jgi:hypothetical protein
MTDQCARDAPEVFMNALKANPCSLNLVPPAKKHKPRTYAYRSSQLNLCYGTREAERITYQHYR